MRGRLRAGAAVLAAALALGLAACSGGEGSAETVASTGEAPATSVRVEVRDGDTGAPVEGATVVATGAGGVSGTTSADGIAVLDGSPRAVRAKAAGMGTAVARVRDGVATVDLYDPDLQSPQYGGDTARTRYVPDVAAPPPSGPPAWRFDGRTLIEFPPVVDDGLVVFGTNSGRVFALDADTGDVRWARRVKGQIASSPAIDGDTVLVSDMGGTLTAYARAGGKPLWTYSTAGSPIESSPLVADGIAYIGDWSGALHAVDVADGSAVWTYRASADIKGSAALAGDAVVVGDYAGVVHSVDAKTGAVRWTSSAGQRFYGGPGVSNGTIVIGDVGGAVIGLSAADGGVRWRHSTGGAYVYSSPAIADGRVFIGSYNGAFQALDLDDGSVVWTHDAGGRISGSATVVDGVVYTAILYAPGQARRTWGLDVATGAVRYRGDDGRYSPAVGAGDTLYLVGTRLLYAYPAPNRGRT